MYHRVLAAACRASAVPFLAWGLPGLPYSWKALARGGSGEAPTVLLGAQGDTRLALHSWSAPYSGSAKPSH